MYEHLVQLDRVSTKQKHLSSNDGKCVFSYLNLHCIGGCQITDSTVFVDFIPPRDCIFVNFLIRQYIFFLKKSGTFPFLSVHSSTLHVFPARINNCVVHLCRHFAQALSGSFDPCGRLRIVVTRFGMRSIQR